MKLAVSDKRNREGTYRPTTDWIESVVFQRFTLVCMRLIITKKVGVPELIVSSCAG